MKRKFAFILIFALMFVGTGCVAKDLENVKFEAKTFEYDGTTKAVYISGKLPSGYTVEYSENRATEIGEYSATAKISKNGRVVRTLKTKFTIVDSTGDVGEFEFIEFANKEFVYDGQNHSLEIKNVNTNIYDIYYLNNLQKEVGVYTVTCILYDKNGTEVKRFTAVLSILDPSNTREEGPSF